MRKKIAVQKRIFNTYSEIHDVFDYPESNARLTRHISKIKHHSFFNYGIGSVAKNITAIEAINICLTFGGISDCERISFLVLMDLLSTTMSVKKFNSIFHGKGFRLSTMSLSNLDVKGSCLPSVQSYLKDYFEDISVGSIIDLMPGDLVYIVNNPKYISTSYDSGEYCLVYETPKDENLNSLQLLGFNFFDSGCLNSYEKWAAMFGKAEGLLSNTKGICARRIKGLYEKGDKNAH